MEIFGETPDGLKKHDVVFEELSEDSLRVFARFGFAEARAELRNRIGFDPYKPLDEYGPEDLDFYTEWLKKKGEA